MAQLLDAMARLELAKSLNLTFEVIQTIDFDVRWYGRIVREHALKTALDALQ